jgi:hypothetical protein
MKHKQKMIRVTAKQLREMILREEVLRGIPDFVLVDEISKMVEAMRNALLKYAEEEKAGDEKTINDTIAHIDEFVQEVSVGCKAVLEEKLSDLIQKL